MIFTKNRKFWGVFEIRNGKDIKLPLFPSDDESLLDRYEEVQQYVDNDWNIFRDGSGNIYLDDLLLNFFTYNPEPFNSDHEISEALNLPSIIANKLGRISVKQINQQTINNDIRRRREVGITGQDITCELNFIYKVLEVATTQWEIIDKNPLDGIQIQK